MQCCEFEERMHFLLDERRAPKHDAQLQSHAQACASCRQLLLDQEALFREICSFRSRSLPRGFAMRVVSQSQTGGAAAIPTKGGKQRPWLLAAAVVSIAAGALIALSITMNKVPGDRAPGNVGASGQQTNSAGQFAGSRLAVGKSRDATGELPVRPGLDKLPTKAGSGSALTAADVNSLEQYGQALQSLAAQVPQAVDRLDEVEEATPGFRPVRTSFTLAIGTIRRTIPPPRKQVPPQPGKRDSGMLGSTAGLMV